jgi:hypothetical protein
MLSNLKFIFLVGNDVMFAYINWQPYMQVSLRDFQCGRSTELSFVYLIILSEHWQQLTPLLHGQHSGNSKAFTYMAVSTVVVGCTALWIGKVSIRGALEARL